MFSQANQTVVLGLVQVDIVKPGSLFDAIGQ